MYRYVVPEWILRGMTWEAWEVYRFELARKRETEAAARRRSIQAAFAARDDADPYPTMTRSSIHAASGGLPSLGRRR